MVLIQFKLIILLLIGLIQISVAPSYCPVGQYGDKYDCTDCPAGRYNNLAHKKYERYCKYCSKAKYAANKITSACSDCSPGLYNNDDENTAHACKKCPQGKTSTSLSAPDCTKCADGQSTYNTNILAERGETGKRAIRRPNGVKRSEESKASNLLNSNKAAATAAESGASNANSNLQ